MNNSNVLESKFFPVVGIKISNKCRMSCKFCCEGKNNHPEYPLDRFLKIIDLLHENGTKRICYTGGEPLLYPHLEEVIKYAYDRGLENVLVSSDGEWLKQFSIPSKYISSLRISVHGLGKYHDDITNFTNAFKNIDESLDNLINNNYSLQIATVLTPNSYDKVNDIVEWCISRGIKKYYVLNILQSGKGKSYIDQDGRISQDKFNQKVEELKKRYSNEDIKIVAHPYERNAECIIVYGDGDVLIDPCLDNEEYQKKIGNIFTEAPESIVNNLSKQEIIWNDYLARVSRSTIFENINC